MRVAATPAAPKGCSLRSHSIMGGVGAIIGFGGMGRRHARALKALGVPLVAMCDTREQAREEARAEYPGVRTFHSVPAFVEAMAGKIDIVCVVTNTPSRADILRLLLAGGAKRVLTEKPFATNVADARAVTRAYEEAGAMLTVNTFRHFCDNHLRLRELIRSGKLGKLRYASIQSASTGLGNMGSVFFDVMNFYIESRPVEIVGAIDKTGTPSPRGPQFRDPGGFGMVRYENGARGFIDTSEDTGVPYTFHLVTTYGRVFVDELFNDWRVSLRNEEDKKRPLTYYLCPLIDEPFELTHGYDPVEMTSFTMLAMMADRPEAHNARGAVTVMEMIMAMHVSDAKSCAPITLPLATEHHHLDVPFA